MTEKILEEKIRARIEALKNERLQFVNDHRAVIDEYISIEHTIERFNGAISELEGLLEPDPESAPESDAEPTLG